MKKLTTPFAALVAFALTFLFSAPQADAHHRNNRGYSQTYVSGYTSCGCKIYTKRYVKYYDCQGYPVYGYKRVPVKHRCHKHHKPRRQYRHYNSCNSNYGYHHNRRSYHRSGNGWSISYQF